MELHPYSERLNVLRGITGSLVGCTIWHLELRGKANFHNFHSEGRFNILQHIVDKLVTVVLLQLIHSLSKDGQLISYRIPLVVGLPMPIL